MSSNRRTGSTEPPENNEENTTVNSNRPHNIDLHEQIQAIADDSAPVLADQLAAKVVTQAWALIQTGYCGRNTAQAIAEIKGNVASPLGVWKQAALPQVMDLQELDGESS